MGKTIGLTFDVKKPKEVKKPEGNKDNKAE